MERAQFFDFAALQYHSHLASQAKTLHLSAPITHHL